MIHATRVYGLAHLPTLEAMVDEITRVSTWTLCSAFEAEGLTLFNDAFSENGAQEYAVFRGEEQVESLTVSWMTPARLLGVLREVAAGGGVSMGHGRPSTDHQPGGCAFCR